MRGLSISVGILAGSVRSMAVKSESEKGARPTSCWTSSKYCGDPMASELVINKL